jgi:hypothetical protein
MLILSLFTRIISCSKIFSSRAQSLELVIKATTPLFVSD